MNSPDHPRSEGPGLSAPRSILSPENRAVRKTGLDVLDDERHAGVKMTGVMRSPFRPYRCVNGALSLTFLGNRRSKTVCFLRVEHDRRTLGHETCARKWRRLRRNRFAC